MNASEITAQVMRDAGFISSASEEGVTVALTNRVVSRSEVLTVIEREELPIDGENVIGCFGGVLIELADYS